MCPGLTPDAHRESVAAMKSNGDALQALKTDALAGMREYLAGVIDSGGEPGYTGADVGECGRILDAYLDRAAGAAHGDDEAVMAAVQDAVLALNVLNERCNDHLIETDQRELLCELIQRAASAAGVGSGADLTKKWREW